MRIVIQEAPFDFGAEADQFAASRSDVGAVVTFTGVVRNLDGEDLTAMEIEHYPSMTERALTRIAQEASDKWDLLDCLIIHRHGRLSAGERIMMVATAAAHRAAAFAAAEFLMDYLKSRAPFWKKEHASGAAKWVRAKDEDEEALRRWQPKPD
ncbi:MAG: molybdenum cofactor biosynthesis protein MoaE [Pseudomonadota bacterium]